MTLPGGMGEAIVMIGYVYDDLYRLTAADYSTGDYYHYTYDPAGNRLAQESMVDEILTNDTYTYDTANRLENVDGVTYTWDDNGNLLDDGSSSYTYDAANRMTSVTSLSGVAAFGYNGTGDRLRQDVDGVSVDYTLDLNTGLTQILYDGTNTYLYGNGRIAQDGPAGTEYFHGDALGSVRQMTDVHGAVTYTAAYSPYGETLGSQGAAATPYGFTGEWEDPSGMVYLRARYYSPAQGRFMTRDTWEGNPSQPLTYNLWGYANNNPVMNTDPSGFSAWQPPVGGFPPDTEDYDQTVPPRNITWITNGIASSISRYLAPIYDSSGDLVTRINAAQFMIAGHEKFIYCASYMVINGQPVLDENNRQICAEHRSRNTNFCGQVVLAAILFHFNPYITATTIVDALNRQDGTSAIQLADYLNANYQFYVQAEEQELGDIAVRDSPGLFFTYMTGMFSANKLVVPLVNIAQGNSGADLTGVEGRLSGVIGENPVINHWMLITGVSAQWETYSNSPYNWIRIFNPFDNQTEYYWWPDFIEAWDSAIPEYNSLVVTLNRINTRARQTWR